ncbi:hypothetical protein GC173_09955 [bacterium]|nr:hypothetical protein [bacterium]
MKNLAIVVLALGLLGTGCSRVQQSPATIAVGEGLTVRDQVGTMLRLNPEVTAITGPWESTKAYPATSAEMSGSAIIPGFQMDRAEWFVRYRIEGADGVAVVETRLVRSKKEPWDWSITRVVPEQTFLDGFAAPMRSPLERELDELLAEKRGILLAAMDAEGLKTPATVEAIVYPRPLDSVTPDAAIKDFDGVVSVQRLYRIRGADSGRAVVGVSFQRKSLGAPWELGPALMRSGSDEPNYGAYPPPGYDLILSIPKEN